jgi:hypothetical protein
MGVWWRTFRPSHTHTNGHQGGLRQLSTTDSTTWASGTGHQVGIFDNLRHRMRPLGRADFDALTRRTPDRCIMTTAKECL